MENIDEIVNTLVMIYFIIKSITIMTPSKVDDEYFGKFTVYLNLVLKILNITALNIGKDKNKDS